MRSLLFEGGFSKVVFMMNETYTYRYYKRSNKFSVSCSYDTMSGGRVKDFLEFPGKSFKLIYARQEQELLLDGEEHLLEEGHRLLSSMKRKGLFLDPDTYVKNLSRVYPSSCPSLGHVYIDHFSPYGLFGLVFFGGRPVWYPDDEIYCSTPEEVEDYHLTYYRKTWENKRKCSNLYPDEIEEWIQKDLDFIEEAKNRVLPSFEDWLSEPGNQWTRKEGSFPEKRGEFETILSSHHKFHNLPLNLDPKWAAFARDAASFMAEWYYPETYGSIFREWSERLSSLCRD